MTVGGMPTAVPYRIARLSQDWSLRRTQQDWSLGRSRVHERSVCARSALRWPGQRDYGLDRLNLNRHEDDFVLRE
jgi:hypothetical protein